MNRKKQTILFLICILIFISIGCKQKVNTIDKSQDLNTVEDIDYTPVEGGTITIPLTNLNTLNPLYANSSSYYHFSKLIFEGLFDFDENLDVVPRLVHRYEISNNGRTVSIELKDNIKWHDGQEFSSSDVKFTIDAIKQSDSNSIYKRAIKSGLGTFEATDIYRIIDVDIIDNRNININFNREYSNNLEVLTFPIIPQHIFNGNIAMALERENYKPIGTGPYRFVEYERFKNIILSKNVDYWNGKPYIDKIIGKVLEDEEAILSAFESGQLNVATTIGVDWDKYKQNSRIKIYEYISPNYEFLGFNFQNDLLKGDNGKVIRKAINYGIDRQAIIEKVYLGHGTQVDVPIHPNSYLYSNEANIYGYNKEKAKYILEETGFVDIDNDGILEDQNGRELSFKLFIGSNNAYRLKTSELIIQNLKDIGIHITIESEDNYETRLKDIQYSEIDTNIKNGNFDIVLLGWELSVTPDLSHMFHSSKIKDGTNFIRYSNESMDEILNKAFYDGERENKKGNYEKIQDQIIEELPYISLFFRNRGLLVDRRVEGNLNPTFFNIYNQIEKCFIPKSMQ
ncbi:peptide ABC transporter substrate-binding protein [Wansuia hejianensis]|uniref:Peptide ABC transporter substrate-binding protein n=1 Tax=Wansuia hejianensis TaxID=2763667 RepID=A0A926F0F0_9FIRM|nr:peptide ABC transporter substrate-binding protein [Wansuia hejianensis]MBC8590837.1 peptide ABC transporter substrate-binding protein [Wansuia hejianensis]